MAAQNAVWREEMMWGDHVKRPDVGTHVLCDVSPHLMMNSHGVWEKMSYGFTGKRAFWEYPLPKLEIMILSTFVLWRFFDILFKKLGVPIPKFTSMMLVGLVLSEAFQSMQMSWLRQIFIPDGYMSRVAEDIGKFAFFIHWFLRGVTTDISMVKKSGFKSVIIGVTTIVIPQIIGRLVYEYRDSSRAETMENIEKSSVRTMRDLEYQISIFTISMTPFTCINMLLQDLKIIHTEFGQIAQSSAMVTDIVAFAMILLINISQGLYSGMQKGCGFLIFIVFVYLVRQAMFRVIKNTPEGVPVKNIYLYIILLLSYLSYLYWDQILFFRPLGAFALGLAIPDGPPLGSLLIQRFDCFNEGIFLPLFGALTMIKLDWSFLLHEFGHGNHLHENVNECFSFLFILHISKLATSFLAALATKMPLKDSVLLGIVLGSKSAFELAFILYAFEKNNIRLEIFTLIGAYILVNSLLTSVAIHFLYDQSKRFVTSYGKRNLKSKLGLQTLVCIKKPDNITSTISLLNTISPSKDSPLVCCVLHLVELVGQATPTFISHQLQKTKVGSRSNYSQNVINSFQLFQETHHQESTSTHMFTSLTYAREMHEHICRCALDKNVNLILLPFHRAWEVSGNGVISDDQTMRSINRSVLKRAPCSVGIFVYRKPIWQPKFKESPCRVCLIYVGGNDDKEALALADNMRGNEQVNITVLRLIPSQAEENTMWNQRQMVATNHDEERTQESSIVYIDRKVEDGTETSRYLHTMAYDYDLFLVGRRSGFGTAATKGLGDWMVFEELGVIGDLLASEYFPSRASVLIIQQHD